MSSRAHTGTLSTLQAVYLAEFLHTWLKPCQFSLLAASEAVERLSKLWAGPLRNGEGKRGRGPWDDKAFLDLAQPPAESP